jgi:hypothetical protein
VSEVGHERLRERAARDGWRLDEHCGCAEPQPVVAGGDKYWISPLVCARCKRVLPQEQRR